MFKFIKRVFLKKEEYKIFDVALRPYIIYSIINIIFVIISVNNIGILNEDVAYGLVISWIIYTFTFMINTSFVEEDKNEK